jgi:hypothetical protein
MTLTTHNMTSAFAFDCCCLFCLFLLQPALASYDPFFRQKSAALTKSMAAAADIAVTLQQLLQQQKAATAAAAATGGGRQQQMEALLGLEAKERMYQLIQVCRECSCCHLGGGGVEGGGGG